MHQTAAPSKQQEEDQGVVFGASETELSWVRVGLPGPTATNSGELDKSGAAVV